MFRSARRKLAATMAGYVGPSITEIPGWRIGLLFLFFSFCAIGWHMATRALDRVLKARGKRGLRHVLRALQVSPLQLSPARSSAFLPAVAYSRGPSVHEPRALQAGAACLRNPPSSAGLHCARALCCASGGAARAWPHLALAGGFRGKPATALAAALAPLSSAAPPKRAGRGWPGSGQQAGTRVWEAVCLITHPQQIGVERP